MLVTSIAVINVIMIITFDNKDDNGNNINDPSALVTTTPMAHTTILPSS